MINALVTTFNNTALQTLTWNERPCWVARHLGVTIGYENDGRKFAQRILGAWSSEMEEGKDYAFLTGAELSAFKAISDMAPTEGHVDRTPRLLVLFESGLHLALLKTNKPLGAKLRRHLADEVLPQIVRTGQYTPATSDAAIDTLARRVEALEQVNGRVDRVENALVKLTELVGALASSHSQPASGARVTVHAPGAQITLVEPTPPPGFTISGVKLLASIEQCSHPKLKKRLEAVGLWDDPEWMWVGERTVPRGNRLDTETFYRFKPSILNELKKRETPLPFPGRGDA